MPNKSITLITGNNKTRQALHAQLDSLFQGLVHITSIAADEIDFPMIQTDLAVYSSDRLKQDYGSKSANCSHVLTASRTLHHDYIEKLLQLRAREKVLVVNDHNESAAELIELLKELGLNQLTYVPFDFGDHHHDDIETAITPGEESCVPSYIHKIVDIGVRLIDITTILKLSEILGLHEQLSIISSRYAKNLIKVFQKLHKAEIQGEKIGSQLAKIVNNLDDGILALNDESEIILINKQLSDFFQLEQYAKKNLTAKHFLPKHVLQFIQEGPEEKKYFSINDAEFVLHRSFFPDGEGIIATFKRGHPAMEVEQAARKESANSGYAANYTFDMIIGKHPKLLDAKHIAKKLALSSHPILIQGATGTGKELFAQAIHNESLQRQGPFVAVNCSAFSASLLESELFGYDEGSFTGAKRGGKKGIFEQAEGGTIFLDEIGDIPLELQTSLLRVLQEKEIRRIGAQKVISANARVIAATNCQLAQKVAEGAFRADLFYRMNVLTLDLPDLKERKSDIPLLVNHFIGQSGKIARIDEAVMDALMNMEWNGNIRELKNTIKYMLTVFDGKSMQLHDLPSSKISSIPRKDKKMKEPAGYKLTVMDKRDFLFILETIKNCNEEGEPASRRIIAEKSKESKNNLTNQQVRHRLDFLEKHQYVTKGRGRAGTKITSEGIDFLYSLKTNLDIL
ncbi:sigma 54-interacting transcriptional regulator [Metabacillus sp. RGM 3146]|uniref:sigma 54-interacting transcriptional regulator n=1 Tax=Metabacillus sp. RGM 3146 TaxID=3401092 RepID=UPI003B9A7462